MYHDINPNDTSQICAVKTKIIEALYNNHKQSKLTDYTSKILVTRNLGQGPTWGHSAP